MIVVGVGAGLVAGQARAAGRGPAPAPRRRPRPSVGDVAAIVAVLAVRALAAAWMVPTLSTLASGMDRTDSLWYHLPLAARFVQTGYLGHIYFFDPIFLASFYPANSEVAPRGPDAVLRPRHRLAAASTSAGWRWRCWRPGASAGHTASARRR